METEIGWGKTSLGGFPIGNKGKKGVGIIRTTVNLSIRRAFYFTFRAKLRASAVSGCRTDPPELGLAAACCVLRAPLNSSDVLRNTQCCSWLRAASFTPSSVCCECSAPRQNWVPQNLWWAEHFFSSDETLSPSAHPGASALAAIALGAFLHGEACGEKGLGTTGRCSWETALLGELGHF